MNLYKEKNKARCKIIIGFLGGLICLILLAMSYLKMIYFLPNIDILSRPIKNLIDFIYSKTLFLDPLWRLSPIPNMNLSHSYCDWFCSIYDVKKFRRT